MSSILKMLRPYSQELEFSELRLSVKLPSGLECFVNYFITPITCKKEREYWSEVGYQYLPSVDKIKGIIEKLMKKYEPLSRKVDVDTAPSHEGYSLVFKSNENLIFNKEFHNFLEEFEKEAKILW